MKFPDDEALRRIKEMEKLKPTKEQQRQINALTGITNAERRAMEELNRPRTFAERHAIEQARLADQALGKTGRHQAALAMSALSSTALRKQVQDVAMAVGASVRHQFAAEMANIGVSSIISMPKEMSRLGVDVSKAIAQSYSAMTPEVLQSIRALSAVNDSPVRLAMETIRKMRFQVESPVFTEFVSDALQHSEPLTEETLEKVSQTHLSETKLSSLTEDQKFWLNYYTVWLGILVAYFTLIQAGKPVNIEPSQIEQLTRPGINITNIFQISPAGVSYKVIIGCDLIPEPNSKLPVIYRLSPGLVVTRLKTNDKWVFVRYEGKDGNKEGWVEEGYLERVK